MATPAGAASASQVPAKTHPHVKARTLQYLKGPQRLPVPDKLVAWSVAWIDYSPVDYTAPSVAAQPVWADNPAKISEIRFNEIDGNVNRVSFEGKYGLDDKGLPLNPRGRTGMCGRGLLGRFGPNHAADPVVTRWKRDGSGDVIQDQEGKPMLEFVAIKRRDNGEWAIPGGMVNPGEVVSVTLKREFGEEAFNTIEASPEERKEIEAKIERLFADGQTIYKGYVDDPRNTDNAWMETVCQNFHDDDGSATAEFKLHAGDDAGEAAWKTIEPGLKLFASHKEFMDRIYNSRVLGYGTQRQGHKKRRVSADL